MYWNQSNSTYSQYTKGLCAESIFEEILDINQINYTKTDDLTDYTANIDYIITIENNTYSVDVKGNYNATYDKFWVEWEQLLNGCPEAWINHTCDYFSFTIADETYMVTPAALKTYVHDHPHLYKRTRYQSPSKGKYLIYAVPRPQIAQLATYIYRRTQP